MSSDAVCITRLCLRKDALLLETNKRVQSEKNHSYVYLHSPLSTNLISLCNNTTWPDSALLIKSNGRYANC